jgi:hypothetical protein
VIVTCDELEVITMLIQIPQPAMALNSVLLKMHYRLGDNDVEVNHQSLHTLLQDVARRARGVQGSKFRALVINCHGIEAFIPGSHHRQTGLGFGFVLGQPVELHHTPMFAKLKGLVDAIVLTSCGAATMSVQEKKPGNGEFFCERIAKSARAKVYAGTGDQTPGELLSRKGIPEGFIDGFEGEAFVFDANGVKTPRQEAAKGSITLPDGRTSIQFTDL